MKLGKLFGRTDPRDALRPLYDALVAEARDADWYVRGQVPDTLDGRFDMLAAVVSLALARLEREPGEQAVRLTELFIDDMDGQLRQMGIGDMVVGKHVGRMMSALGGRLGAYRATLSKREPLEPALLRNLYRERHPGDAALAFSAARLGALSDLMNTVPLEALLRGRIA